MNTLMLVLTAILSLFSVSVTEVEVPETSRNTDTKPEFPEGPDFQDGGEEITVATFCLCKDPEDMSVMFSELADPKTGKCSEKFVNQCRYEGGIPYLTEFTMRTADGTPPLWWGRLEAFLKDS